MNFLLIQSDQERRDVSALYGGPARAAALARLAREKGVTVPATDLLVAACARHHGVSLEHNDSHFDLIATLSHK